MSTSPDIFAIVPVHASEITACITEARRPLLDSADLAEGLDSTGSAAYSEALLAEIARAERLLARTKRTILDRLGANVVDIIEIRAA